MDYLALKNHPVLFASPKRLTWLIRLYSRFMEFAFRETMQMLCNHGLYQFLSETRSLGMVLIALNPIGRPQMSVYWFHYCDVIMGAMASQFTSLKIVHSTFCSEADQRNKSSAPLMFVRGIHRWPQRDGNAKNISIWWRHRVPDANNIRIWYTHAIAFTVPLFC